jgi:hypothetical protein
VKAKGFKAIRRLLILLVIGIAAAVILSIRQPSPDSPITSGSENAHGGDSAEGVELCRVVGANEDWCLKAQKEFGQKDGVRDWRGDVIFNTTFTSEGVPQKMTIRSDRCTVSSRDGCFPVRPWDCAMTRTAVDWS